MRTTSAGPVAVNGAVIGKNLLRGDHAYNKSFWCLYVVCTHSSIFVVPSRAKKIPKPTLKASLSIRDMGISPEEMNEGWYKDLTKAIEKMVQQGVTQKTSIKGGFKVIEQQVGFTEEKAQTAAAQPQEKAPKETAADKPIRPTAQYNHNFIWGRFIRTLVLSQHGSVREETVYSIC